ncbi:MAG: arylsulfatase [Nitrososphaerales archaeon]
MSERTEFRGKIGLSYEDSTPWWPTPVRPPKGAPNVLYIVLDDVGFGHLGCYGGAIDTPNLNKLAENGLRFTDFHTTALCSPTRSCLLTGRNHHSNHMACITEGGTGFPGYDAKIPKENGTVADYLKTRNYNTYALGKWHLTPTAELSWIGPYGRWPLGQGFDHYYGFLGGETNQWYPDLIEDNKPVAPPGNPKTGYQLTTDLADHAIGYIANQHMIAPDLPFFMYFCPGACHAPHHAPKEWIDKQKGKFDKGWDVIRAEILERQKDMGIMPPNTELAPALAGNMGPVPTWDSLNSDQKILYARFMEVFAAYLSFADGEIGRLVDFLENNDMLDNTLIFVVSDNGASGEGTPVGSVNENKYFNYVPDDLKENLKALDDLGGPKTYEHYPQGWALAGNTPFKFWKRYTYQGGISDPCIIHWPNGIKAKGELRHQYHHANDLVPTVLEVTGIEMPFELYGIPQRPIEGISMAYCFNDANVPTKKETQYYEMLGSRAIWHKGWKAVTTHKPTSQVGHFEKDEWELYNVDTDRSEIHNLAKQYPEKVEEMRFRWFVEATKFNVLPLDDRGPSRVIDTMKQPSLLQNLSRYTYYQNTAEVPENIAANVKNLSHSITADVELSTGGAEGIILTQGSRFGGYSLFVKNNRLVYVYNYVGLNLYRIISNIDVPAGRSTLKFEFQATGKPDVLNGKGAPGVGRLMINGTVVGEASIPLTIPVMYALTGCGLTCGYGNGESVSVDDYQAPFKFTGKIREVVVEITGEPLFDAQSELRKIMATV